MNLYVAMTFLVSLIANAFLEAYVEKVKKMHDYKGYGRFLVRTNSSISFHSFWVSGYQYP